MQYHSKNILLVLVIGTISLLSYSIFLYSNEVYAQMEDQVPNTSSMFQKQEPEQEKATIKETLHAKSYIIYDINNKRILRSKDAYEPLPIASLTKIITVATLLDKAKKANARLGSDTQLVIKKALIQSSNDDADFLGDIHYSAFGTSLLKDSLEFVRTLGLNDIKLTNLTGLDRADGTASNMASPESIAKLFAYVYENHREIFEYTRFGHINTEIGTLKNTNKVSEQTFGIMASKTGFTWEAGGNLGVIVSPEPGSAYVILVMKSTKEGRFSDVKKLSEILPLIISD